MTETDETELAALRARVAELEGELHQQAIAIAATCAEAQEKLYWLERTHLDMERIMHARGTILGIILARKLRKVIWSIKRAKRRIVQD